MRGLAAYQGRVVAEKAELDAKLYALATFANTPVFSSLDPAEQDRMVRQSRAMRSYSDILGERIAAFTATTKETT